MQIRKRDNYADKKIVLLLLLLSLKYIRKKTYIGNIAWKHA